MWCVVGLDEGLNQEKVYYMGKERHHLVRIKKKTLESVKTKKT